MSNRMHRFPRMRHLRNASAIALAALALHVAADWRPAKAVEPLVIADFSDTDALKITADDAATEVIDVDGDPALQITAGSRGQWPGVEIKRPVGGWDLSRYEMVQVDIHNPQQTPVRVLLSMQDPQGDGRRHTNTEGIEVPAGGKATLTVPFGAWHGELGREIDQSNIVALKVMLDRPGREHTFVVDRIRAVVYDRAALEKVLADPFYVRLEPALGRGINLGNALEAPREGEWGVTLRESYFEAIAEAGFDSVRIPIRWSSHAAAEAPYTIEPAFFDRVDWAIEQCLARDLEVVINVHHYGELMDDPAGHRQRFLALWRQIAEHYRDQGEPVVFELLNEPQSKLDAAAWNDLLSAALAVVRESNPTRRVVVGPANFNSIDQLAQLKLPEDDRRLIVTVHYYSPFNFTHQGAHWLGGESQAWLGTKWTGTPAEQRAVQRDLDRAITWAVEQRRPIYLGEFGAYQAADLASRARWTKFLAEEATARKMGFAYWEFCSGFGAYDAEKGAWIEPLREALLPHAGE